MNTLKLPSPSGGLISLLAKSPRRENARSTWLLKVRITTCQKYKSTKCPCTLRLFIICFGICLDFDEPCYKNVHIHEVDSGIIIEERYLLSLYSKTSVTSKINDLTIYSLNMCWEVESGHIFLSSFKMKH